ncbi:MAG: HEAT repeat domain-containing protein [Planctomycetia bacterium]|nr:HEAT repeat domain-containing protein [Planctomycetia bacterium]
MLRLITLTIVLTNVLGLTGMACADDATAPANDPQRVVALIRQLGADKFQDREAASRALEAAGAEALEPLRQAAKGTDLEIARRAAEIVPIVERNVEIAALIQVVARDTEWTKRMDAAEKLGHHGKYAARAFPMLLAATKDEYPLVSYAAIKALGRVDPKRALPELIGIAQGPVGYGSLPGVAAIALGEIGPLAREAVPVLVELLAGKDRFVRRESALALGLIGGNDARLAPALLKATSDSEQEVRYRAVEAVGRLQELTAECVPALIDFLQKHQGPEEDLFRHNAVVGAALQTLGRLGPRAEKAVPVLLTVLKNERFINGAHVDALKTLELIGPAAKEAVPLLNDLAAGRMYGGVYRNKARRVLEAIRPRRQ